MNFSSYFVLSSLVVFGVMAHAYVVHEQFYPAVVYLSTDKMCLAVMYNFAFALFLSFGKMVLKLFIGTLRDLEVEQLIDSGRGFLADTILFLVFYAPTIDNREVGTVYLIQYICCVIFMKVFHLTTQIRVSHMFEVGVPRLIVNVKLVALMCLLLSIDIFALQYFYNVASRSSTFFTWILFEALTMSTVVLVSICKYSVHMVDLRLDNGWPAKSVCLFYIDLIHDVVSMTLFLVFMLTFFVQNPSRLPIYMMADVIQVARKLAQRLRSFRRYRRISTNMEARFADATDPEIEANEHCVICRDSLFEGSRAKKLACGHIFHIDCLRSWLVMQQVCPTCRAEIPPDGPLQGTALLVPPAVGQQPPVTPALDAAGAPEAAAAAAATAAAPGAPSPAITPGASPAAAAPAPAAAPALAAAAPAYKPNVVAAAAPAPAAPVAGATSLSPATAATSYAAQLTTPTAPAGQSAASSTAASASALPRPALQVGDAGVLGPTLGALPPVTDIMESLARAEDIAKFLRQQTEFWMEQVKMIEQNYSQPTPLGANADPSGLMASQCQHLLGGGGASARAFAPSTAATVAAGTAAVAASVVATASRNGQLAPAVATPAVATAAPAAAAAPTTANASTAQAPAPDRVSSAASQESSLGRNFSTEVNVSSPERNISTESNENGSQQDQLSALRRSQKEAWERKKSQSQNSLDAAASANSLDVAATNTSASSLETLDEGASKP